MPSTPLALNLFVHVSKTACNTSRTVTLSSPEASCRKSVSSVYLVQFGLGAGEREGESYRKLLILDFLLLHEVAQAIGDMSKELRPERRG